MKKLKSNTVGILVTVGLGLLLGFFGVLVSVFSDGSVYERLVTILVILIIYAVLSIVLGLLKQKDTWLYMMLLSVPGALMLIIYMIKEFNFLYIIYIMLIMTVSYFGTKCGKSFKTKKK